MTQQFFIERVNTDGSRSVISRHDDAETAINHLNGIKSNLRHEVWSYNWVNTAFGFAPIAWIN